MQRTGIKFELNHKPAWINHQRTIGIQVLSNHARSDPKQGTLTDLKKLFEVKDKKFVTAGHSLLIS